MSKNKEAKETNKYNLITVAEPPSQYISGDELLSLLKNYSIKVDTSNIPRFASNNSIKMTRVKRVGSEGSTPTFYQKPTKNKIEEIIHNLKNINNSSIGKEILKKKRKEVLRIFDNAKNNSINYTAIAILVSKTLNVNCNRKFVAKILSGKPKFQLEKKLFKRIKL